MKNKHSRNYELLGIRPGDSWQKLRDCYKSAINKWHPDRFAQNNSERGVAEERTKEINRAFRELQEHYLRYGSLPLDDPQPTSPHLETIASPPSSPHPSTAAVSPAAAPRPGNPVNPQAHKQGAGNRLRFSLALMGLLLAGYLVLAPEENELTVNNHLDDSGNAVPNTGLEQTSREAATKSFTTGSSLGEVHSVQGIPTRVDGEIWYYGDAKVFFKNGKVSHWVDSADRRLLAASNHDPQTHEATVQYFDRGSTKAEVRTLQGVPMRETDKVWDYGLSRVYFSRDKVVGWSESPLDPLRIKR